MPSAVITGANSGIGYEFAKVLIDAVSPGASLDHFASCLANDLKLMNEGRDMMFMPWT